MSTAEEDAQLWFRESAALKAHVSKLTTALTELEGFAKRNVERAKKAADDATQRGLSSGSRERIEASARYHEAQRVYDVIRMRVKEALDP